MCYMPAEYRAVWATQGGGTGYSVFHFQVAGSPAVAATIASQVRTFFTGIAGFYPDDVNVTFDSEVLDMDEAGTLTAVHGVTPPAAVPGLNNTSYNRAAGLRIDWSTGHIVAGRRLTGRTFIVPAAASVFDTNGLVTSANVTAAITAGNALITASASNRPLVVWSRTHQVSWAVQTCSCPTKGAILTGRRD
jgi:hypothetical protein